ncbi:MAG TPA: PilW family protein [Desulfobacterales bacterium]
MMGGKTRENGFTLIELMIAMAVGLIAITVIIQVYTSMQASNTAQKMVVEMQQNARAALVLMKREIRMAGYDPAFTDGIDNDGANGIDDFAESSGAGFLLASPTMMQFTLDNEVDDPALGTNGADDDGDGQIDELDECCYDGDVADTNENITFSLFGTELERTRNNPPATASILAYDIEAVRFAYAFDSDGDGELDRSANGHVIWAFDATGGGFLNKVIDTNDDGVIDAMDWPAGSALMPSAPVFDIRAVRIWLLARTRHPVRGHSETRTYVVGNQHLMVSDGYQRCLLETTVFCRNMGL